MKQPQTKRSPSRTTSRKPRLALVAMDEGQSPPVESAVQAAEPAAVQAEEVVQAVEQPVAVDEVAPVVEASAPVEAEVQAVESSVPVEPAAVAEQPAPVEEVAEAVEAQAPVAEVVPAGVVPAFDREAAVRLAAYAFYEARGGVGGNEVEDWLKAEAQVAAALSAASSELSAAAH